MRRTVTAAIAGVALAALIGAGVAAAQDGQGPAGRLGEALGGLVSKGTITQEQADSVEKALTDARAEERAAREQDRQERRTQVDALLESTLGIDSETVMEKLRDGQTLLQIAGDSADELAAGMTDLLTQRLDRAVNEGRITEEQAAETLTRASERADAWLAGEDTEGSRGMGLGLLLGADRMGPGAGMGHGPGGGPGNGRGRGHGDDGPAHEDAPAETTGTAASWQI